MIGLYVLVLVALIAASAFAGYLFTIAWLDRAFDRAATGLRLTDEEAACRQRHPVGKALR